MTSHSKSRSEGATPEKRDDSGVEQWLADGFAAASADAEPWLQGESANRFQADLLGKLNAAQPAPTHSGSPRLRTPLLIAATVLAAGVAAALTSTPELTALLASIGQQLGSALPGSVPEFPADVAVNNARSWLASSTPQLPALLLAPLLGLGYWALSTATE